MRTYYPLTAAQKMHHEWIQEYHTQQVSGVSVVASWQTELDFERLKQCIRQEYERYSCMRVRFTKPDETGEVKQYIAKKQKVDVPFRDLSHLTLQEADEQMQQWAYETFDGDEISLCEVIMVKLPQGYQGFFVHMDHRLIDSCGLMVLVADLVKHYTQDDQEAPEKDEIVDYETVLAADLKKAANEKRWQKDKKFWEDQLDALGEPLYADLQGPGVLEESRRRHQNPSLRAADYEREQLFVAVKDYQLEPEATKKLLDFCETQQLSMTNLLLLGMRTYLSKVNNGQEDITIQNFISRRSTHDEWMSGGSRTIMFPCRTVLAADTDFLTAANAIQTLQNHIYLHSHFDPAYIREEMRRRYHTPAYTRYESCYLTYQPMTVQMQDSCLQGVPQHAKWFANGAATKKLYLTVSHTATGGMNFSFHYQTVQLNEHDMELFYYYLMRILFAGVEQPTLSLGDIMQQV